MKRRTVIGKIKAEAKAKGLAFQTIELTNHTAIIVGGKRSTLARHSEIADDVARMFFAQYQEVLGKGWWR